MLHGIDISRYQKGINIGKTGADFVIVKASEGTQSVYATTKDQANATLLADKLLGLYHFARPDTGNTAAQEADAFVAAARPFIGKAILVLDWERGDLTDTAWVKTFLDRVESKTKVRPLIYMSASVIRRANWSKIDTGIWVAGYPRNTTVIDGFTPPPFNYILKPWKTWTLWQYTSSGRLPGWNGHLDLDVFNGTRADWLELATPAKTKPDSVQLKVDGQAGPATIKRLQTVLGTTQDGVISGQSKEAKPYHNALFAVRYGTGGSNAIRALQHRLGVTVDGSLGPATIRTWQQHLKTKTTSHLDTTTVRAIQKALNTGAIR